MQLYHCSYSTDTYDLDMTLPHHGYGCSIDFPNPRNSNSQSRTLRLQCSKHFPTTQARSYYQIHMTNTGCQFEHLETPTLGIPLVNLEYSIDKSCTLFPIDHCDISPLDLHSELVVHQSVPSVWHSL